MRLGNRTAENDLIALGHKLRGINALFQFENGDVVLRCIAQIGPGPGEAADLFGPRVERE